VFDEFYHLLSRVQALSGPSFSGIGLIVSDYPERLPLAPLSDAAYPQDEDVEKTLAQVSRWENAFHDGFHVLSSDLTILRFSQYFAPPPVLTVRPPAGRASGARYLAAQLGSLLPDVQTVGIASRGLGLAIFEQGAERLYEAPR